MYDDSVSSLNSFESQGLISLLEHAHPLVKYCQFGLLAVNHSDSDFRGHVFP